MTTIYLHKNMSQVYEEHLAFCKKQLKKCEEIRNKIEKEKIKINATTIHNLIQEKNKLLEVIKLTEKFIEILSKRDDPQIGVDGSSQQMNILVSKLKAMGYNIND